MSPHQSRLARLRSLSLAACALLLVSTGCSRYLGSDADDASVDELRTPGKLLDAQGLGPALQVDLPGRMSVLVQVLTDDDQPVADLTAENFRLFEDGGLVSASESQQRLLPKPRVFRSYSHLLLDLSGSVAQTPEGLQNELEAAHRFVDEVTASPENFVAISWFFGAPDIAPALRSDLSALGFTNQPALLHEAIDNVGLVQVTSTSTNLYGAVIQGLDALDLARDESDADGIEFTSLALVTFTDGSDQAGLVPRAEALARLNVEDVQYSALTIGLGAEIDEETLNLLGPSGFAFAGDEGSLADTFAAVGGEVRNLANSFYLVGYVSPKVDGSGAHTLTVEAFTAAGSASRDYPFDAAYFSGGGGFLDVADLGVGAATPGSHHLASVPDDGRVVLTGASDTGGTGDQSSLWISRAGPQGNPDPDFGSGPASLTALTSVGPFDHLTPVGIVAQGDGSGWVLASAKDFAGSTEGRSAVVSFGAAGNIQAAVLLDAVTAEAEFPRSLQRSPEGKLLVLSQVGVAPASRTLVRRLDSTSLVPDPSFGGGGAVLLAADAVERQEAPQAMALDADGRLLIAGTSYNAGIGAADLAITCLMPTGGVDTSFGSLGRVFHKSSFDGLSEGLASAVSVSESGSIVVAGQLQSPAAAPAAAWWRLSPEGIPDSAFTGNASNPYLGTGLVTLGGGLVSSPSVLFGVNSVARTLQLRPSGELLSAGQRSNARGDQDLCFWSLSSAGVFSQAFNATGFLIEDGAGGQGSDESANSSLIHRSGRIFTLGTTRGVDNLETTRRATLWQDREPSRVFAPFGENE